MMNTCARGITEAASLTRVMRKISVKPPKTWRETHALANDLYPVRNSDIVITIWFISNGQLKKTFTSVIYK